MSWVTLPPEQAILMAVLGMVVYLFGYAMGRLSTRYTPPPRPPRYTDYRGGEWRHSERKTVTRTTRTAGPTKPGAE